ncbi:aminoglycoside phosphotransferase family protein [Oceaniglobus ichthyenteri]|uniref:aminoglycoside phosphotransferase family protein n=1 Tax=Oceaniglobus ichthyenteri TaxID=2136177 RepID=UPI000D3D1054|nr:phosphotransferase [Oceaniglobus ichthyenteri]
MNTRTAALDRFLASSPWSDWARKPLAGDASNRRYDRLFAPNGQSVVVMDSPDDDVRPFVTIARHLRRIGLSAPGILARDPDQGFLVIEDLGDALFATVLGSRPEREQGLYALAIDALIALHQHPPLPDVPRFQPPFDPEFIAIAYGWYCTAGTGAIPPCAATFCTELNRLLVKFADDQSVLILRDYHAENLLVLPGETGVKSVGLLDFQDAMAGHPAYDLVSLVADARRDVSAETRTAMIDRYITKTGCNSDAFRAACAVLSAQRNLRILGVFARLCVAYGKAGYIDLIPRVWGHLMRDLAHPALGNLRDIVLADLPAPTPDHLQHLRQRCATLPR